MVMVVKRCLRFGSHTEKSFESYVLKVEKEIMWYLIAIQRFICQEFNIYKF